MGLLDRKAIKDARDLKTVDVEVPEWGGTVRLQELSDRERIEWFERTAAPEGEEETPEDQIERGNRAGEDLILLCAVNEQGDRILTEEDRAWIRDKSTLALQKVIGEALKLNHLGPKEVDAGKDGSSEAEGSGSS